MSLFLILVEESDADETRRDMHYFVSVESCYEFISTYVTNLKLYEWANDSIPPRCPTLSELISTHENTLETIYTFEYQVTGQEFFCIEVFLKRTKEKTR